MLPLLNVYHHHSPLCCCRQLWRWAWFGQAAIGWEMTHQPLFMSTEVAEQIEAETKTLSRLLPIFEFVISGAMPKHSAAACRVSTPFIWRNKSLNQQTLFLPLSIPLSSILCCDIVPIVSSKFLFMMLNIYSNSWKCFYMELIKMLWSVFYFIDLLTTVTFQNHGLNYFHHHVQYWFQYNGYVYYHGKYTILITICSNTSTIMCNIVFYRELPVFTICNWGSICEQSLWHQFHESDHFLPPQRNGECWQVEL